MSRRPSRSFLRAAALLTAAALALSTAACVSTPQPKADTSKLIWPNADEPRFYWEATLRSSQDVVAETGSQRLRRMATGETSTAKSFEKPHGLAAYDGYLFIGDTVSRKVRAFDLRARRYYEFGNEGVGTLAKPMDLTVANGQLYVCDSSGKRIVIFGLDGTYKASIGGKEYLERPSSVAVSADGSRIYVVDTGGVDSDKHRLVLFDATGRHIKTIGKRGNEPGNFNLPISASVAPNGNVYVVDGGNFRIQVFSPDGRFIKAFGDVGRKSGQFARPKAIAADRDGNVYITDSAFANFQIFNGEGQLLLWVGERGENDEPGRYMLPTGIAVDPIDGRVYVSDQFFRKVDVFRPVGTATERVPREVVSEAKKDAKK